MCVTVPVTSAHFANQWVYLVVSPESFRAKAGFHSTLALSELPGWGLSLPTDTPWGGQRGKPSFQTSKMKFLFPGVWNLESSR